MRSSPEVWLFTDDYATTMHYGTREEVAAELGCDPESLTRCEWAERSAAEKEDGR